MLEFETQPEYLNHLKRHHPERHTDVPSNELISAAVGPSAEPRRDCPFCPTVFSDMMQMQKHITFHLERLALVALPPEDTNSDDGEYSVQSEDSHEPLLRGRQRSLGRDFSEKGLLT